MSSLSGLKKVEGQRLSLRLAALCAPSTLQLNLFSRHVNVASRAWLDVLFTLVSANARSDATMRKLEVDGAAGRLPARLYEPTTAVADPGLLVYFHGGGFALGSVASHDNVCRFTAEHGRCKVLSIGYRKAPEHRLPGAFEDCRSAFRWSVAHAAELGIDPTRVAVGGDSAGGQLAAAVSLHTDGGPTPAFAWLLYPLVDADISAYESAWLFERGPLLSRRNAMSLVDQYAPTRAELADPRLTLITAEDSALREMPPTYLATAGMDPLRDQGEAFVERLRAAGAAVEHTRWSNLPHGFDVLLIDPQARRAFEGCCDALHAALSPNLAGPTPVPEQRQKEKQMDEATLRPVVEAHAAAVVDPIDVGHVQGDLIDELHEGLPQIAEALPQPVTSATVDSLELEGDAGTAVIRYTGAEKELSVESRWEDVGAGAPKIVAVKLLG